MPTHHIASRKMLVAFTDRITCNVHCYIIYHNNVKIGAKAWGNATEICAVLFPTYNE